jgi:type I restriction enzyme S subunit
MKSGFLSYEKLTYLSEFKYLESPEIILNGGEILITKVGAGVGENAIYFHNGERVTINPNVMIFVPNQNSLSAFINYFLLSDLVKSSILLESRKSGAQPAINQSYIKSVAISLPTLTEQTQIANFLDFKTTIIDDLIGQKEKLINLLKEKRQAIINEAVTKGLNPNAKMKDSGIEWLGEIPEEWKVLKLKYLLRNQDGIKIGPFGSALKLEMMVEDGYKVYGQENAIKDNFEIGKRYITQEKFLEMESYKLQPGDIIVTMMGTTGKSKVVPENIQDGIMDSHLIRIRVSDLIIPELLALLINDSDYIKTQLDGISKGAIMTGLNSVIIKSLNIIVPPKESQKELLKEIDRRLDSIFMIMKNTLTQITKLKDYRQSLISEAVTGKIDVRDWKPTNN